MTKTIFGEEVELTADDYKTLMQALIDTRLVTHGAERHDDLYRKLFLLERAKRESEGSDA